MNLTEEQQQIVNYVKNITTPEMVLIDSVAGSGKTTLLQAIAKEIKPKNAIYLAYNKAIATSSSKKFPPNIDCRTTHSLAYAATVKALKLTVGFFGPKQIKEKISYKEKYLLSEDIREFCLSKFLTYNEYAKSYNRTNVSLANKYLNLMSNGKIEVSHDFYLKLFHIMLVNKQISQVPYDLVMLDEAGDLNEVTLEIFKNLTGRIKIAVGDPYQNIYTFNHTINCFEHLKKQGVTFKLSKSFRVPETLAAPIEAFCKKYLDPDMKFKGTDLSSKEIVSRAYISRTNSELINKIIQLNQEKTPYGLVRKAQEIFKLPLMIASLKYQGSIYDPTYKHLQEDVNDYYENKDNIKTSHNSLFAFLKSKYAEDISLMLAINLVSKYGAQKIFTTFEDAKKHENKKQNFILLTAHSCKGLEFDEVILAPDMETYLKPVLDLFSETKEKELPNLSSSQKENLNLYYVACTRALISLKNATHL